MRGCVVLLLCAVTAAAATWESAGTAGAVFLRIPTGARMVGLAEAVTAFADDPYAIAANPAGVSRTRQLEISFSHTEWIQGVRLEYLGFSRSFFKGLWGKNGTLGAAVHYVHVPEFFSYDEWGAAVGTVSYAGWALSTAYGQEIGPVRLGAGLRLVGETRHRRSDAALTMNLGGQYTWYMPTIRIGRWALRDRLVDVGVCMDNWGLGMKVGGRATPVVWKFGAATRPVDELLTTVQVDVPAAGRPGLKVAGEYGWKGTLFGRLGYRFWGVETDGLSVGMGAAVRISGKVVKADLAWAPQSELGHTLVLSLSMKYPGRMTDERRRLVDTLYFRGIWFFTRGEYDNAIEAWKVCLEVDPDFEPAKDKIREAMRLKGERPVEEDVKRRLREEGRTDVPED